LFGLLVIDGNLSRLDGGLLLISFIGYIIYSLYYNENEDYQRGLTKLIFALSKNRPNNNLESSSKPKILTYVLLVISVLMLGLGSKFAVDNLLVIVEELNIAVGVISFFALAIGTSLPELTVSIKALKKGQGDVLVGNIIGSCMFNMLLIGGVASLLHPQTLNMAQGPWMVAGLGLSALILLSSGLNKRIHIWEGAAFVLVYVAISFHII
jgi:cation:H+ antiporter